MMNVRNLLDHLHQTTYHHHHRRHLLTRRRMVLVGILRRKNSNNNNIHQHHHHRQSRRRTTIQSRHSRHVFYLVPTSSNAGLRSVSLGLFQAMDQVGIDVGFFKPMQSPNEQQYDLDDDDVAQETIHNILTGCIWYERLSRSIVI